MLISEVESKSKEGEGIHKQWEKRIILLQKFQKPHAVFNRHPDYEGHSQAG